MATAQEDNPLQAINSYVSASQQRYAECIDAVEHQQVVDGIVATTRMHHLRFDGNGQPMIATLAEYLYNHIIDYCIAARHRAESLTALESTRLTKEARKLFIHPQATQDDPDRTGEAGEILLYLLMEVVLRAPQVVAKMELKTSNAMEVHGSDGIHMAWNATDSLVDVYFGEAKLYQDLGAAISKALKSVEDFHAADMCRHEFRMVTKHFKYADARVRAAVKELLGDGVPCAGVRINHACLIGYNWAEYARLPKLAPAALMAEFQRRYVADAPRLHGLLQARYDKFQRKSLRFEVFLLPFTSVQGFRDAFNAALA